MDPLRDLIFNNYESNKSSVALRINNEDMSYEELFNKSLKVSTLLQEKDVQNETVGIVGHRKFSTYIGILGVLFSGCNYTPINPKNNQAKIIEVLTNSKIKYLIGNHSDIKELNELIDNEEILKQIKMIITPMDPAQEDLVFKKADITDLNHIDISNRIQDYDDSNLAYVLYTSGSTGKPKGVQVTRANLSAYIKSITELWGVSKEFRMSQFHDLSFDPSVSDIFYTFCNKGTLCVVPENEMMLPSEFIKRESIDIWSSVPSIGIFMMKMGVLSDNNFCNLKIVRFAGEPLNRSIADAWQNAAPNASIENHYGPTEATVDVLRHIYTRNQKNEMFNNNIIPIGKSFPRMIIKIINNENNVIVDKNKKGEIIFSGPQITNGYLNDQNKTNEGFVKFSWDESHQIWYRSGDIGFLNNNNCFECVGRKDAQIKIAGRRIEIGEIEHALSKFNETCSSVVVPKKDDDGNIIGCVAFVTNPVSKDALSRIRKDISKILDAVFFPKKIISIESFPKTQSGKINRKKLELIAKEN